MTNAVATVRPMDRFRQEVSLRKNMMAPLLPKNVSFDKFEAMVIAAVGSNPKLLECDRASLLKACIQAAELGLSLNPTLGEGDILQVWDNRSKKYHAQFRPRYGGLMKLALQSGHVLKIEAEVVREGDDIIIEKGSDSRLVHRMGMGKRGQKTGAYCVWTLRNGEKQFEYMDREQIEAIRDRSSAKNKDGKMVGPWASDEDEMWRKTVVRRASKYMPRSVEGDTFRNAVTLDNLHEAGHDTDFDNGEVIDITDFPEDIFEDDITEEPEQRPARQKAAAKQMDDIAAKVAEPAAAPDIEKLEPAEDDDGIPDWDDWCNRAVAVVEGQSPAFKKAWIAMHATMLNQAEFMEPQASYRLKAKLK